MDGDNEFGAWTRRVREQERYSQDELARMMGYAQTTVSRIELGKEQPTAGYVLAFCKALNVSLIAALDRAGMLDAQQPNNEDILDVAQLLGGIPREDRHKAIAMMEGMLRALKATYADTANNPASDPPQAGRRPASARR